MDIITQASALSLVKQILEHKTPTLPKIPSMPQKPPFDEGKGVASPFPRSTPEAHGISSDYIYEYLDAVQKDRSIDPHSVMIIRGGEVIAEGGFGAYRTDVWHISHSECKSITGLAIGMLIDEGKLSLDDRISRIFEKRQMKIAQIMQKNITVRDLLTMSTGISFNEAGTVTETDWVKCYLESVVKFEPGTQFSYNSMNTYMLSAIVREITGEGLMEYLRPRLWEPLEITQVHWETCPKGIEKGGMGMYIRPEDIAKIGQLFLQKGAWKGQRLVSEEWIEQATRTQIVTPDGYGDYNYGYQLWTGRRFRAFLFNGMFGQNVFGFPDNDMLVVCTSGNNELFQQSHFFALTHKYFAAPLPNVALPADRQAYRRLTELQSHLRSDDFPSQFVNTRQEKKLPLLARIFGKRCELCAAPDLNDLPAECLRHNGERYDFDHKSCGGIGLLPLFEQAIQNNYTKGMDSVSFLVENGKFYVTFNEIDESYRLPVGFGPAEYTTLVFHGESHLVGVQGEFTENEDHLPVLKLRLSFLEIANSRMIKIFFRGDSVLVRMSEQPGRDYLMEGFQSALDGVANNAMFEAVMNKIGTDLLFFMINASLEPEMTGKKHQF